VAGKRPDHRSTRLRKKDRGDRPARRDDLRRDDQLERMGAREQHAPAGEELLALSEGLNTACGINAWQRPAGKRHGKILTSCGDQDAVGRDGSHAIGAARHDRSGPQPDRRMAAEPADILQLPEPVELVLQRRIAAVREPVCDGEAGRRLPQNLPAGAHLFVDHRDRQGVTRECDGRRLTRRTPADDRDVEALRFSHGSLPPCRRALR
jgi:hypothetical protein